MLDAEEKGVSSRGRLDLLLEQLGIDVVSETLEVEIEALSRLQSGVAPLEGGVLERMNALGKSMGMTVDWWEEEIPLSDVVGVELKEPEVALEEELPAAGVSSRSRSWGGEPGGAASGAAAYAPFGADDAAPVGDEVPGDVAATGWASSRPMGRFQPPFGRWWNHFRSWPRKRLSGPLRAIPGGAAIGSVGGPMG